jgi:hypothetical protein
MPINVTTTIATIRAIAGVAKEAGRIDLYNEIIGLQQTILEAIGENTELAQANAELTRKALRLEQRIHELEQVSAAKEELTFRGEAYWRVREGQPDEGPYCARCYLEKAKAHPMTPRNPKFTCCVVCDHCISRGGLGTARPYFQSNEE